MAVPPPSPGILPPVNLGDFDPFLEECGKLLANYTEDRRVIQEHFGAYDLKHEPGLEFKFRAHLEVCEGPGQGLVEAMRAVPSIFFDEDFSLAR